MTWSGKRVLVTGAGGFIGSHLTERLVALGAHVRAFVHYNALGAWGWLSQSPARGAVHVVMGDICDRDSVHEAIRGTEVVFHLAALIGIPYSYHAPSSYVRTNIDGTLNVLQAARTHGVERLVHTSTSEVYGSARYVPMDEAHPLQGQSPYSASKIGADKLAESFHLSFDIPVVTVRPFNTFGPRQSSRAVIPTIISQCLSGERVRLGNVSPRRDLNYVTDTVEAFVLAAVVPGVVGRTINVGSGREISVGDLAEMITALIGRTMQIEAENERVRPRDSEVDRLLADNTLARQILGWQPSVTLEAGLRFTIDWMREAADGYRPGIYAV
jgi:dTDP-glucose 4,6-dehydratase